MANGTRPYGVWAYSFGPYSTWRLPVLGGVVFEGVSTSSGVLSNPTTHLIEARLGGQSSIAATLYADLQAHVGPLTGRSSLTPNLRLYWEPDAPCDAAWAPGVPCDTVWAPAPGGDVAWAVATGRNVAWASATGEDAPWTVAPPPPLLCPELEVADG